MGEEEEEEEDGKNGEAIIMSQGAAFSSSCRLIVGIFFVRWSKKKLCYFESLQQNLLFSEVGEKYSAKKLAAHLEFVRDESEIRWKLGIVVVVPSST